MLSSLCALIIAVVSGDRMPTDPPYTFGSALERTVTMTQNVRCESPSGRGALRSVEIWVAVPSSDERQSILDLKYSSTPSFFDRDQHGNTFAVFHLGEIQSGERVSVGWTARVRTRAVRHTVDVKALLPLRATPLGIRRQYLGGGGIYDLSNRQLRDAAREAGHGARNALELAFKINEYVRERLSYLNDGRWDPAGLTLQNGHGSCSEYNFLFMALCRLNNLAARYVGASALRGDCLTYKDSVHHRWTEVYLPGHGWFPVDVSRNDGEDGAKVNQFFGSTSERLLVTMKGDGGRHSPLEWGYVARIRSHTIGDALMHREKSFTWRPSRKPATVVYRR